MSADSSGNSVTTSDRFDRIFWRRLWRLARPYWVSENRAVALALLGVVVALSLVSIGMQAVLSYVSRDIMNALQAKNAHLFYHLLIVFGVWILIFVPVAALYPYLTGILSINWRNWMTEFLVNRMLRGNALYHIMRDHRVDNPDQRISEDANNFTSGALTYSMTVLQSIVTAATFFGVLWVVSHWLAICLIGYSAIGTWLTVVIGRRLVGINFNQQRFEADYRFALVRARDNAEAIALYDGERDEARNLRGRFARVVDNFKLLLLWQRHLAFFTNAFDNAAGLVPYFVLAGAYFSGRFQLGEFTQAAYAFSVLQGSLSLIVDQFQQLTDYASVVNRLAAFEESCEAAGTPQIQAGPGIEVIEDNRAIAIRNVTLTTPDGARAIQRNLSIEIPAGARVLINGPSGAGKTSLMRAVAGLWPFGNGTILRPAADHIMYLPQKPYLILGSLRRQLQYPRAGEVGDQALIDVLRQVSLSHIADHFGGLDREMNWADVLSGGEQQRLAIARLILNRPDVAFLDEATSALDIAAEEEMYRLLTRMPITLVSIGHRPSLRQFHSEVVELGSEIPAAPAVEGVVDGGLT